MRCTAKYCSLLSRILPGNSKACANAHAMAIPTVITVTILSASNTATGPFASSRTLRFRDLSVKAPATICRLLVRGSHHRDHPPHPEFIGHHSKTRRPKGFHGWHFDLSAFRESIEDFID